MAYNYGGGYQQGPFWDFVRGFDQHGAGVDHAAPGDSPMFGPPPHDGPGLSGAGPGGTWGPPPHDGPGLSGNRIGGTWAPSPHDHVRAGLGGTWAPSTHDGPGLSGAGPGGPWAPPTFGPGFPFGGRGGWGGGGGWGGRGWGGRGRMGCRGRHGRREHDGEEEARESGPDGEQTEGECQAEGEAREGEENVEGQRPEGSRGRRGHHGHGRGGPRGCRGGWGHHGRHGHGPHGHRGPPPHPSGAQQGSVPPFDLSAIFEALGNHPIAQHPWAQALRNMAEQAGAAGAQRSGETLVPDEADETFTPPVDIFSTERSYILHIALPGAKKEDVGVNFDSDQGVLSIAGVVYRHGDEEFLKTLTTSERKVGMFERTIKLPPGEEEKEEVDGDNITAKLEDGVLVVTVAKVEKDWTEVKRVDIE